MFGKFKIYFSFLIFSLIVVSAHAQERIKSGNEAENKDLLWIPDVNQTDENSEPLTLEKSSQKTDKLYGIELKLYVQGFSYNLPFTTTQKTGTSQVLRQVLDFNKKFKLSEGLNFNVSNRLDYIISISHFTPIEKQRTITNVLKEAYISFSSVNDIGLFYFDIGRVNIRNGVGAGYNPTDFLKDSAVVTSASYDPGALRLNRLGVFMANVQYVGNWGSFTFAAIPKLKSRKFEYFNDRNNFDLDLSRTNSNYAFYLKVSPEINETMSLDLLAYIKKGEKPRFGMNISALLNDYLVGNIETSVLKVSPIPKVGQLFGEAKWYSRISANIVWTTSLGLELTAEINYAGDGADKNEWQSYRNIQSLSDINYFKTIQNIRSLQQERITQAGYFLYAGWQDAFKSKNLTISAFMMGNFYDESFLWQTSISYAFGHFKIGGLISGFYGSTSSEYGGSFLKKYAAIYISLKF
jgi:hypothetical protein